MNEQEGAKDARENAKEVSQSRWFFVIFFGLLFLSVGATFYRTFIARDYFVIMETTCDPAREACFERDICETEDGMCAEGDMPVETSYYKIVERKAFAFPEVCASGSLGDPVCADLSCRPNEAECTETLCTDETVPEGESCAGPGMIWDDAEDLKESDEIEGENENVLDVSE